MDLQPVTIIGSYLSPFVRKVLVALHIKGIPYRIDPIVPFFGNDAFSNISPARRVPVLLDGELVLPDSTVICEYLEDRYPSPHLLPQAVVDRAAARWLEEYADTRIAEVLIWQLYNERIINRFVWGKAPDEAILQKAMDIGIPGILRFLESRLPDAGFLFERISVADIAIATFFRNAGLARFAIDAGRWPVSAGFVARVLDHPAFVQLRPYEELLMRTPISAHREALQKAGAPVTDSSFASASPRRA